jgi:hypothetical protein
MVQIVHGLQQQNNTLQQQVNQLQQQQQQQQPQPHNTPSAKPPLPQLFSGQEGKGTAVEQWLFAVDRYFTLRSLPAADRVPFASTLLTRDADLWYQRRFQEANGNPFATWADFATAIRARFTPVNATRRARDELAALHQTGSVRAYISAFTTLCLQIPGFPATEQYEQFLRGLKPAIRKEVEIRGITTFEEATSCAERVDTISFAFRNGGNNNSSRGSYSNGTHNSYRPHQAAPAYDPMELDTMEDACSCCRKPGHHVKDCPSRPPHPTARHGQPRPRQY